MVKILNVEFNRFGVLWIRSNKNMPPVDPSTQAWMKEMTNAVVQRTWATAIRTIASAFTYVSSISLLALFAATTAISPMAGVITAAVVLVSLMATMWGVALYMSTQSSQAVTRWKIYSDSLRPPPPTNGETK